MFLSSSLLFAASPPSVTPAGVPGAREFYLGLNGTRLIPELMGDVRPAVFFHILAHLATGARSTDLLVRLRACPEGEDRLVCLDREEVP